MIVLGIDPGSDHTGWAVVRIVFGSATEIREGKRIYDSGVIVERKLLQAGTWKFGRQSCREWCAEHAGMTIDLACIQTPLSDNEATPMWHNRGQGRISPVSIAKNAALSDWYCAWIERDGKRVYRCPAKRCQTWGMKAPEAVWRAAWGWTGRISADARDAAQIAVHGAREWAAREQGTGVMDALLAAVGAKGKHVEAMG
jgi:hypothetical protein